jgi:hypothetical protein
MEEVREWKNELTEEDILKLCEKWRKKLKVSVKRVQIKEMRNKWGSYSRDRVVTLHKELLKLPLEYVEYVILHQLLHAIVPTHNLVFKALLYVRMPEWEKFHEYLESSGRKV